VGVNNICMKKDEMNPRPRRRIQESMAPGLSDRSIIFSSN
jgi:hypothetical protein